ncbi:WD40 repeat domain-containing protein [Tunicatimonas pelagia]|nr:WD40 repeat domain-containing protein [Tunicatimonas pelagia]WKN46343.1 WD40 repeat domain-containing protein [Tunicatimonas pelagia]
MNRPNVQKIHTLRGHNDCVYTLAPTAEPGVFISGGGDGMVVRWDLQEPERGKVIAKVEASVYALHFNKHFNHLIVGQNYEGVHIVDLEQNKALGSLKMTQASIFDIKTYRDRIFVATSDGQVAVLHYQKLAILHHIQDSTERARSIAIHPKNHELVVGYSDNSIRIYDLTTYQLKRTINAHQNSVFTLQFTPDQRFLLSGSRDAHLKIWDTQKNYELHESIVAHMYAINHIDFQPDGRLFATCSMDKSVKIWDAERFQLLKVIDKARHAGHGTSVNRLLWLNYSQDGLHQPIVSASDDRTISVWKMEWPSS